MNAAYALVCGAPDDPGRQPSRELRLHTDSVPVRRSVADLMARDAALVSRLRAGDTDAFEAVYRAYASGLAGFANAFVHAPDIAEEIVGDVFVRVWEMRATFNPSAGIRAYLYAAVRHRALDHLRADRRANERYRTIALTNDPEQPLDVQLEHHETIVAVQRVIDTFPALRRQILDLRWGQGLGNPEIAAVLGLTDQAVRSHISRAIRDLRAAFPDLIS
jgi:RNA polymerase sigma-70 factor (family 1)